MASALITLDMFLCAFRLTPGSLRDVESGFTPQPVKLLANANLACRRNLSSLPFTVSLALY